MKKFGALELNLNGVSSAVGGGEFHAQHIVHEEGSQVGVTVRAESGTQLALGQGQVAFTPRQRHGGHVRLPVDVGHVELVDQVGVPVQPARPFQAAGTLQHFQSGSFIFVRSIAIYLSGSIVFPSIFQEILCQKFLIDDVNETNCLNRID